MPSYIKEIQLTGGDTAGAALHGNLVVEVDGTRHVFLHLPSHDENPERRVVIAPEDWDAVVTVINEAEMYRGKVVTARNGQ